MINSRQLPFATIMDRVQDGFLVESANNEDSIDEAIVMARVTGSVGCTCITQNVKGVVSKFAIVKRIK